MQTLIVIELKVAGDSSSCFRNQLVVLQIHLFIFHGTPQAFDENVVQASSSSIHADGDVALLQLAQKLFAGKLRALIAIEDLRAAPAQRALQGLQAEVQLDRQR